MMRRQDPRCWILETKCWQVLVPDGRSELQLEWAGPYKVTRQVMPVDYEVETPGRCKGKKIYHTNLLKKWHFPHNHHALLSCRVQTHLNMRRERWTLRMLSYLPTRLPKVMAKGLTLSQQEDLKQLLNEFPDVAGEKLGSTAVISTRSV